MGISQLRLQQRVALILIGSLALALSLALGVAGVTPNLAHASSNNAFVRVVHAAPAAPNVDVYVDNNKLLSNFTFGTVTDYVPLAAGQHEIAVAPAGKTVSDAVIKQSVTVTAGVYYTVAAIGDTATTPALVAFQDDNGVATGMAKVRVYHLSSDAGPVAVAAGGKTVIPDLTFKNASGYLTVAPGSYTFDVTLKNNGKTVQAPATLAANKVTSVFALGLVNGSGATAFKFAAATVAGTPTGMPSTGFAPASSQQSANFGLIGLALFALLLVGGTVYFVARRATR